MIPYGKQEITDDDIEAVVRVLRSDFLTQGPEVPAFEEALGRHVGAGEVVAMNSATSALHVACMALDVGPGDLVWTTAITFVASANCARYCGADVDFVDIDAHSFNMSVEALGVKLRKARQSGRLPKVVIPVHLCGQPCDMQELAELSREYGFRIIEDASHAIGASYQDQPVGNCEYSDIAVFSFHPVKIVTSGEGGAAATNDPELGTRMRLLRSHGVTRNPDLMRGEPHGPWYYEQICLGYNYRMTDMSAALGQSQLKRLDTYVAERNRVAQRYHQMLEHSGVALTLPSVMPGRSSAWHLYVVQVLPHLFGRRSAVFQYLREQGIGVNVHYMPVYRQPYYSEMGFDPADYPNSEFYYSGAITLPLHPQLTEAQQAHIVFSLKKAVEI